MAHPVVQWALYIFNLARLAAFGFALVLLSYKSGQMLLAAILSVVTVAVLIYCVWQSIKVHAKIRKQRAAASVSPSLSE